MLTERLAVFRIKIGTSIFNRKNVVDLVGELGAGDRPAGTDRMAPEEPGAEFSPASAGVEPPVGPVILCPRSGGGFARGGFHILILSFIHL